MTHASPPEPTMSPLAVSRPRLTLVPIEAQSQHRAGEHLDTLQSTLTLALVGSLRESATEVRPSAWHALLESLWPHETLELVHRFIPGACDGGRYRFEVSLRQSMAARASQSRHVLPLALAGVLPRWQFRATDKSQENLAELPLRATLSPAPLRLTHKDSRASRMDAESEQCLPFPAELPSWFLTTPFDEPLIDGQWTLELSFTRYRLEAAERERTHRLWQGLRRGSFRLHRPQVAAEPYWHDAELDTRTQTLLQSWLSSASGGYCLTVRVRAESYVPAFALQRIARDVFGSFPVIVSEPDDLRAAPWPLLAQQGLGGLFAADKCAREAGIVQIELEPKVLPPGPGAVVGFTQAGQAIGLPDALRSSHTLVVGASGSGKSTLLRRLMLEDIHAGSGVAVLDSHGELFDDLLASIPRHRAADVVVIDVADPAWSVALNPLQGTDKNPRLRNFVCGQIVDLIDRLFENDESSGPVTKNHLRYSLMLAMSHPSGPTLADAPRAFLDDDFRDWLLTKCDERTAQHFRAFTKTSGDNGYANWRPYITARFEPFVTNTAMLAMLCRPSSVDLAKLMQRNAIVLFRLSKTVLSETECQVLGSLLLMQFHTAAMAGSALGQRTRRPFHLVVDEFQNYVSPAVPLLFRESRKFGLCLTVATQSVGSLRHPRAGDLASEVMTNTAAKVFFRMSPREALKVDEYTAPEYPAREVARLANYHAVLSLPAANVPPLCFKTALPRAHEDLCDTAELREQSGKVNGTPMGEVQAFLAKRHDVAF